MQYLAILIIVMLVFSLMGTALWFSKYKKKQGSCCSGYDAGDSRCGSCSDDHSRQH